MTSFKRTVKSNTADRITTLVKTEEEKWYALTFFEVVTIQSLLEPPIAVDAFGTIKIDLPEIGTLVGVVTFESHTGRLINEARAIPIPARNCVAH
jgi:hypothetical protein